MAKSSIDTSFWNNSWSKLSFGRYYGVEHHLAISRKLGGLLKQFLVKGNYRVLEIGCARAKQLIYLAKEYGYRVYGLDLSEGGTKVARENLRIAKVDGTILCEDVFKTTLEAESFDLVYSMGLVEHFYNLGEVVEAHIKLLKPGGLLLITLPNFRNSFYLALSRFFGSRSWILQMHNIGTMDKSIWPSLLRSKGLTPLFLDYFGPLDLTLSFGMIKCKPILYPMLLINQVIGYCSYFMGSSKYFSPYLVLIARKVKV